jgi:hypothetical protein
VSKKMMSLVATGVLIAAAAFASDAWKDKDFQTWDQKDVQKILTDSPWAKKVESGGGLGMGRGGGAPNMQSTGGPGMGGGAADSPGHSENSSGGGGGGQQGQGRGQGQQMTLTVTWNSSRTIREAMARKQELAGTPSDVARKGLSEEPADYEVEVTGTNLMAFGRIQQDDLKSHSYLMSKATKDKVAPANIAIQRGPDGRPAAIIFQFAKKTDSGEPTIAPNEKSVEFFTQAGSTPVKVQFDISKMMDKAGADY